MTEAELQASVLEIAQLLEWMRAHFRAARTSRGWRTPVEGDGKGFPDLVLLRRERMIVAELKGDGGKPSPEQLLWLAAFDMVPGIEVYLWSPDEWHTGWIETVLKAAAAPDMFAIPAQRAS